MSGLIHVFIADDHHLVREGIGSLITENEKLHIIGEAAHGKEVVQKLEQLSSPPDVVLMDINMPVMDGIECTKYIVNKYKGSVKVVALTMVKQAPYIRKMLQAGAVGYLLKDCDKNELYEAIDAVNRGDTHFSQSVSLEVMNELTKLRKADRSTADVMLSKREQEVLHHIVEGLSNQSIAEKLHISIRTVETHKQNMISKTGSQNVAGLVVYAIRNRLVDV